MPFDKIEINTSQNVLLRYEPAGVIERGLAWLIDLIIIFSYSMIILIIGIAIISSSKSYGDKKSTMAIIIYTILSIPILMYDFLWEYFSNGQSVGKKVMAIKVVKLNGTQPSAGAYLLRWLLRIIDFMLGPVIAIFSISVTKNYQRLGDLAADTTVIKLKGRTSIRNTILYKAIPGYEIQFRQVEKLSDKDISIIKEVFDYCRKNRDDKALLKLAEKVRQQLGLDKVDKSPEEFINTILIDYSQFEFKN